MTEETKNAKVTRTKSMDNPKEQNEADAIWNEIKNLSLEIFSLPNQRVLNHVTRKAGLADAVVLVLNSPAVLPALEATLVAQKQFRTVVSHKLKAEGENVTEVDPKYVLEEAEGYVLVKRYTPPKARPELQSLT